MTSPLVAIEEHWMLPELAAALEGRDDSLTLNRFGDHEQRLTDLADGRIAAMDEQGIDVSVIALTPPGTQALPPDEAVRLSRAANDTAAAAVARRPDRFRALSTLPLSAPGAAADELRRAADLGHVGTMVYGHAGRLTLDDPAYDDLWATAARLRQPVFLHPQLPSEATRDALYRGFDATTDLALATFGWGWHVDAATAALRLIVRGTFDRHPDLQLILGHWGELLLFWLDRADGLARAAGLPRAVSEYVRSNVYVTASGMLDPAKLRHVLTVTTPDRLLFSTDYPFQHPTRDEITAFLDVFPERDRPLFTTRNAATLFDLDL
ncbi:amidohydrolase family protein [Actinomadura rubteroloni]|uniref:amidohydrolase family protein n=1 Tax=Actinomadura rubteroloni TaxID=1926885 RepID=UPI00196BAF1D|nr:amidohydrolase family protein [Actinomadura rubteroloni]